MIRTETITINGAQFVRTYSDIGALIERDGIQYSDAIDPVDSGRVYTEAEIADMDEELPDAEVVRMLEGML